MQEPNAGRVSSATLRRIETERDAISAYVTDHYIRLHPECCALIPEHRLKRVCKEDLAFHLEHIVTALETGDDRIFVNYLIWLRSVLEARHLSLEHPRDSLGLVNDYLLTLVEPAEASLVSQLLEKGIKVFGAEPPDSGELVKEPQFRREEAQIYTRSLLGGQRREAGGILVDALSNGLSYVDAGVGIVQPAMYEIGRLWQGNRITVAQEHLATAISQNALAQGFAHAEFAGPNGRSAVFACIAGNHHTLGLRMISDAYELAGWRVDYLGADTPTRDLLSLLGESRPDMLGLSVSMPSHVLELRQIIAMLKAELGNACPALTVGGLSLNVLKGMRNHLGEDAWYADARSALEGAK